MDYAVSLTLSAEQLILNDQFAELARVTNGFSDEPLTICSYTLTLAITFVKYVDGETTRSIASKVSD